MAGSIAAAAKARLVGEDGVLAGLPGMAGVEVSYSMPRDPPRELVVGGRVGGPSEPIAMRGGTRIRRSEDLRLALLVRVHKPGEATAEATDARAVAIGTLIENYISANPRLGDTIADLKHARVVDIDLDSFAASQGYTSELTIQVALTSVLA